MWPKYYSILSTVQSSMSINDKLFNFNFRPSSNAKVILSSAESPNIINVLQSWVKG